MASSQDRKLRWGVQKMGVSRDGSSGDEELTRRGFQEMESLRDMEFRSCTRDDCRMIQN